MASPNVLNYSILKGVITFKKAGALTARDLGNAPEVELTPELERRDHFSSRTGVRTKDRNPVVQKSLQIRIVLDEWTADNIGIGLMSDVTTVGPDEKTLDIFSLSEIIGEIRFTGTNDIGAKVDFVLPSVSFTPSGSMNLISDEWGQIEITGDVLSVAGSFGTATVDEAV